MAKITLLPGEEFEHFHSEKSITILTAGKASIKLGNEKEKQMKIGISIEIPEKVSHLISNNGNIECSLDCYHGGSTGGGYR